MENINNCHVFRKRICLVIRLPTVDTVDRICSKFRHSSVCEIYLFEIISNKFYNLIFFFFFFLLIDTSLPLLTFEAHSRHSYRDISAIRIQIKTKYIRIIIYCYWNGKKKKKKERWWYLLKILVNSFF